MYSIKIHQIKRSTYYAVNAAECLVHELSLKDFDTQEIAQPELKWKTYHII